MTNRIFYEHACKYLDDWDMQRCIILKKVFVKNSIAVKKWFSEIEFYFVHLIRLV